MIEALGSVTRELASAALDFHWARQAVLSHNIANASVPGYQAIDLDFESWLGPAQAAVTGKDNAALKSVLSQLPALVPQAREDGQVRLDDEVAASTKNALQYRALLSALEGLGALNRIAITGGST